MIITIDTRDDRESFKGGAVVTITDTYGMETTFFDAVELFVRGLVSCGYSAETAADVLKVLEEC